MLAKWQWAILTCACAPGMDGARPNIAVADKEKEKETSQWKFIVDAAVFVVNKSWCFRKIYENVEQRCFRIIPSFEERWPDENKRWPDDSFALFRRVRWAVRCCRVGSSKGSRSTRSPTESNLEVWHKYLLKHCIFNLLSWEQIRLESFCLTILVAMKILSLSFFKLLSNF